MIDKEQTNRWASMALAATMALLGACASGPAPRSSGGSLVEIIYLESTPATPAAAAKRDLPVGARGVEARDVVAENPKRVARPASPIVDTTGALPGTHPILRERAQQLVARLASEGIVVKLIFGYTPYSPRKRTGPGGWASWHEFGLAFDLNLVSRKSLGDAKKHFKDDAEKWRRVGELAAEIGLVWGGSWRSTYDPFHFEWHPGQDSVINKDDLRQFLKLAGPRAKNYQKVWSMYEPLESKGDRE